MEKRSKSFIFSIIVFIIGCATLATGAVFFVLDMIKKPAVEDANFLVEIGEWVKEGEDSVIWNFTEVGKGKLTTNNHINDYDFIWAIEGDTLKIETTWLYDLNNSYTFKLDQGGKTLTLTEGENTYTFVEKPEVETPAEE